MILLVVILAAASLLAAPIVAWLLARRVHWTRRKVALVAALPGPASLALLILAIALSSEWYGSRDGVMTISSALPGFALSGLLFGLSLCLCLVAAFVARRNEASGSTTDTFR